jgi:hypothetical protein
MTTAVVEFDEQRELSEAPDELRLTESATVVAPSLREGILERARARGIELREGEELLQIIRPCVGRGKGTREYQPGMLEADAPNWRGVRMFRNHLTEAERKKLEGLPRPIEHLAGRIRESWWDGDVPASSDGRYGQGGVFAAIKPTKFIREMLDDDPDLIESSISALATALRPERRDGRAVSVVEGIRPKPRSVDWVTEGGAGGKVLRESAHEQEEAVLESMTDQEIKEYLKAERPGLLEALDAHREGGPGSGNDDRRQEDDVPDTITPEALTEALATDAGKAALAPVLSEAVQAALADYVPEGYVRADEVESLVESKMAERADLIRIEARGDLHREVELRDLADQARTLVEAAKLHPKLAKRIVEKYALVEGAATDALAAVKADFDPDGNVTKSAAEKLAEAVAEEIEDARALLADVRPTRVRGQGRTERLTESRQQRDDDTSKDDDTKGRGKPKPVAVTTTGSSLADELLEGAGFSKESLGGLWTTGL